jgi:hypothetical protein
MPQSNYTITTKRPDVLLAQQANKLVKDEGLTYGDALDEALRRDPELAKTYGEWSRGKREDGIHGGARASETDGEASRFAVKPPPGKRLITRPASDDLAEAAAHVAAIRGVPIIEAQAIALREDERLRRRYQDEAAHRDPHREFVDRAAMVMAEGRAADMTAAGRIALAERPELAIAVDAYYETGVSR